MSFEDKVHLNWTNAVFYFTHNFLSFENEISAGLSSESSEVRCASIAIINQCNSITQKEDIFRLLDDNSEKVVGLALEYLLEFGETHHAAGILKCFDRYPFLSSSSLDRLIPNSCGIINDDDTQDEKQKIKHCWQKVVTQNGN